MTISTSNLSNPLKSVIVEIDDPDMELLELELDTDFSFSDESTLAGLIECISNIASFDERLELFIEELIEKQFDNIKSDSVIKLIDHIQEFSLFLIKRLVLLGLYEDSKLPYCLESNKRGYIQLLHKHYLTDEV